VFIDPRKIVDYVLSTDHARGRHKARVFSGVLGLGPKDAGALITAIRVAAESTPAVATDKDEFGQRYLLDFTMNHAGRSAMVRTCWIVLVGEDFARLTSCYVL
jgi:hypothetical protein